MSEMHTLNKHYRMHVHSIEFFLVLLHNFATQNMGSSYFVLEYLMPSFFCLIARFLQPKTWYLSLISHDIICGAYILGLKNKSCVLGPYLSEPANRRLF